MQGNPDISYAVSTEIYDKISEQSPGLIDQMTDIGFDYERGGRNRRADSKLSVTIWALTCPTVSER